jgi:hypothetical protein
MGKGSEARSASDLSVIEDLRNSSAQGVLVGGACLAGRIDDAR